MNSCISGRCSTNHWRRSFSTSKKPGWVPFREAAAAFAPILNNLVLIALFVSLPRLAGRPISVGRVLGDTPLLLFLGLGTTAGIVVMAVALWPALRGA